MSESMKIGDWLLNSRVVVSEMFARMDAPVAVIFKKKPLVRCALTKIISLFG